MAVLASHERGANLAAREDIESTRSDESGTAVWTLKRQRTKLDGRLASLPRNYGETIPSR